MADDRRRRAELRGAAADRQPLKRRWIVLGAVLVSLAILALAWDWNWLKGPLERRISERTGRALVIGGDLDVDPGFPTRVQVHDVRFDNPAWAQRERMITLASADFSIRLLPLLRGRLVIPDLVLMQPEVDLERSAGGADNWTFGERDADAPDAERDAPVVGRLQVDRGVLHFLDPAARSGIDAELETTQQPGGAPGVRVRAAGTWKGNPLAADGAGGAILSLADADAPYPFEANFRVGSTHGTAAGTVTGMLALAAAEVRLDVRGESLAELFPLIGVALPATPPYRIQGRLVREGRAWRMNDFTGGIGDSDIAGDAAVILGGARPRFEAELVSKLLDLDDLGGVIGAPSQAGPGETASPRQRAEAARKAAGSTLLPAKEFDLTRLRAMDAEVTFTGKSIRGRTPVDDLTLHLTVKDGVLSADPLNFGVAGGDVTSRIEVDARGDRLLAGSSFVLKRIDLQRLFPTSDIAKRSVGLVGGRAALRGEGNSLAQMLAHADGNLGLATGGGKISNLLLELVGLDAAETLTRLFRGDKQVNLRCAVADFAVRDGVMQTRTLVIDTADTNITVDGNINLRDETLDLTIHPLPKDFSLVALRSPLHVTGRFKALQVRPDEKALIRGGVAAILGALAGPLAALIPLLESGPGDDVDCDSLIAAAERHAGAKIPAAR